MSEEPPSGAPAAIEKEVSTRDSESIRRIAQHRDEAAFRELFNRYQHPAFNLALQITLRPELAEEAVQEAFLSIWKSAGRCRPEEARPWILAVITNASLKVLRAQFRYRRSLTAQPGAAPPAREGPDPERLRERHQALRGLLAGLAPQERQLLTLYYGAGLTQEQIGALTNLSQRNVSHRLVAIVAKLRQASGRLALGLTGPAQEATLRRLLGEDPYRAPEGLLDRTVSGLQRSSRGKWGASHHIGSRLLLLGAGVLAVVAALAQSGALEPRSGGEPASPSLAPGSSAGLSPATPSNPASEARLPFRLDFQEETSAGCRLPALRDHFSWQPHFNAQGGAILPQYPSGVLFQLPVQLPAEPLVATILGGLPKAGEWSLHLHWGSANDKNPFLIWQHFLDIVAKNLNQPFTFRVVILERLIAHYCNGTLYSVTRFERSFAPDRPSLAVKLLGLQSLTIERLPASRIPAELEDWTGQPRDIRHVPPSRVNGWRLLSPQEAMGFCQP